MSVHIKHQDGKLILYQKHQLEPHDVVGRIEFDDMEEARQAFETAIEQITQFEKMVDSLDTE